MDIEYHLTPILNKYLSCHQIVLATLATYYGRDYKMILAESWGFRYDPDEKTFGSSIHPGYQRRRYELLEKYHGLKAKSISYYSVSILTENIASYLSMHGPLLLKCDIFNCQWNMSYHKDHVNHYVLICGASYNSDEVKILDPFTSAIEQTCRIQDIANPSGSIEYLVNESSEYIDKDVIISEIRNTISYIEYQSSFRMLNAFNVNLREKIGIMTSIDDMSSVYSIPLIFNLHRIANQRQCYVFFLEMAEKLGVVSSEVVEQISLIADLFRKLRLIIVKQIIKKRFDSSSYDICKQIETNEKKLFVMLSQCIDNG